MTSRATCRNCGDPIEKDDRGWFHTRLPLKGGKPDTNCKPCRATPGGFSTTPQRDLFEVNQ